MRWILLAVAVAIAAFGAWAIAGQAASGTQPWSSELSDALVLAKAVPFALALGVAAGLLRGRSRPERRADGSVRRFARWTVVMHGVTAAGFLLALPTGVWQYLGGILDAPFPLPVPLYVFYRVHYAGALVILFAAAAFLTAWWWRGERGLLVPRGGWTAHLRGLADELGRPTGPALARILRLDLRPRPPESGPFTFYEKVVSFPTWTFAIGLITVTGLVKAMRYVFPVPGPVLYWSSAFHVMAMVVIMLKTLDHIRYTIRDPGMLAAMATGWLPARGPRTVSAAPSPAPSAAGTGGAE